ncbi:hypothetical protein [Pelagovum pacificum]|uniref:Uncharacterized protein n=1 Tax=Pelagovum pacificum TaxID=2588711 RepID=A0A5C5GBA4_9RHOB|nr:hypothetical protein [Pelagovum pacificum]QQA44812.1 hypothetical protein I8N54_09680 [Pelagovum pacificum]TNY32082.1 hypothetical protein FHY64_01915 [Pelagovum pacificum]
METTLTIIVLVVAALAGNLLIFTAIRKGGRQREALKAAAVERNWTYRHTPATGGKAARTEIGDPSGDWRLTIVRGARGERGSGARYTTFETGRHALPAGLAVLGPALPAQTARMAEGMLGSVVGSMLGKLLMGLGTEAASDVPRLETVETHGTDRGTLMATPEATQALDPLIGNPDLLAARDGVNEVQQPIVLRGTFGMSLRVRKALTSREEVIALATLGQTLSAALDIAES